MGSRSPVRNPCRALRPAQAASRLGNAPALLPPSKAQMCLRFCSMQSRGSPDGRRTRLRTAWRSHYFRTVAMAERKISARACIRCSDSAKTPPRLFVPCSLSPLWASVGTSDSRRGTRRWGFLKCSEGTKGSRCRRAVNGPSRYETRAVASADKGHLTNLMIPYTPLSTRSVADDAKVQIRVRHLCEDRLRI